MAVSDDVAGGRATGRPVTGMAAIGLTGAMGAGKSTALSMFRDLGALAFSADEAVHHLYLNPEVRAVLHARFGDGVLDDQGVVDREALAGLVAGDDGAMMWLEAFIHPRVGHEIHRMLSRAAAGSVVVCEVPLLFEVGLDELFDLTVTVEAAPEVRRSRNVGRMPAEVWEALEGRQLTSEARARRADMVFFNEGDELMLRVFVAQVFERARAIVGAEMRRLLGVEGAGA